ncbi:MAG: hypothetical protein ACXAD7_07430 [Candidatus Kariarchaeaceae archaeon]|jgi:hypothetical protein
MKNLLRLMLLILLVGGAITTSYSLVSADEEDETKTEDEETETTTEEEKTETEEEETKTEEEDEEDEEEEKLKDEEEDEIEDAYKRELEVQVEKDKLEIKSELKVGETKDKFEIKFDPEGDPEIELVYKTESDATETAMKYRVEFESLYEYLENSSLDLGYQESEQVSEYKFEDQDWNDLSQNLELINGEEIYTFTASTADGVFQLVMKISAAIFTLENNATLTPNSLKIDVEINNFPYTQEGTSLALETKIKTKSEFKAESETDEEDIGFASNESQIGLSANGTKGFFSWAEIALSDGLEIDVLASSLVDEVEEDDDLSESESSKKMYFSFISTNATNIIWDPKVGVISEATHEQVLSIKEKYSSLIDGLGSEDSSVPGFDLWMGIFVLGIFQVVALQYRRRS